MTFRCSNYIKGKKMCGIVGYIGHKDATPVLVSALKKLEYRGYDSEVASRISANNIPDIAYMGIDERWGSAWREANQFVDNTSYFPSFIDTDLVPSISISGTNIKPYLPLGGPNYCSVVGVNTSLLTTVDPTGRIPETYTDLLTLVQKVEQYNEAHDTDIKVLSTHGADEWVWGSCVLSGIIPRTTGDAGWIEKAVDGQVDFTDDDFITALNVIKRWIADGILDPASATTNDQTGKNNFAQGKYVMYTDNSSKETNNMSEKTIKIEGMMCSHCEMHVKKALEAIPGVESAVASHEKGNAVVTLTSPVDDAALRKAVEEAGYKVVE